MTSKTTTNLLKVKNKALRRTRQYDAINARHIEAKAHNSNVTQHLYFTILEPIHEVISLGSGRGIRDRARRDLCADKLIGYRMNVHLVATKDYGVSPSGQTEPLLNDVTD